MKRIYIDFDSIFDTRMGLIHQHAGSEVSKKLATNERYFLRDYDDWSTMTSGAVTDEQFAQWWAERDASVLPHSMMTSIIFPLKTVLDVTQSHVEEGIEDRELSLLINTWPYRVGVDVERAITHELLHHLGYALPVVYIFVSPEDLTPQYLVENVHFAYLYDYSPWVTRHGFRINQLVQSGLTMTVPRQFFKNAAELTKDKKKEALFYFDMATRIHMNFVFIEMEYFSMFRPQVIDRLIRLAKQQDEQVSKDQQAQLDFMANRQHNPPPK